MWIPFFRSQDGGIALSFDFKMYFEPFASALVLSLLAYRVLIVSTRSCLHRVFLAVTILLSFLCRVESMDEAVVLYKELK